ncbi:hypothetical protein EJB05_15482, partial [Eragrostis curvula]
LLCRILRSCRPCVRAFVQPLFGNLFVRSSASVKGGAAAGGHRRWHHLRRPPLAVQLMHEHLPDGPRHPR